MVGISFIFKPEWNYLRVGSLLWTCIQQSNYVLWLPKLSWETLQECLVNSTFTSTIASLILLARYLKHLYQHQQHLTSLKMNG